MKSLKPKKKYRMKKKFTLKPLNFTKTNYPLDWIGQVEKMNSSILGHESQIKYPQEKSKLWRFIKVFFLSHCSSFIFTSILTFSSSKLQAACVFSLNHTNKNFDIAEFFSTFLYSLIVMGYQILLSLSIMRKSKFFQIIYIISFLVIWFALLFLNKHGLEFKYVLLCTYSFISLFFFGYALYVFSLINYNLKLGFQKFLKEGFFLFVIFFSNYSFCTYLIGPIFRANRKIGINWGDNINKIILMFYTSGYGTLMEKFLFFYYEIISKEQFSSFQKMVLMNLFMRMGITEIVSLNMIGILGFDPYEWGGWLFIIGYMLFILTSLTGVNFSRMLFNKIRPFLPIPRRKRRETKSFNPLHLSFQKLLAGSFLDILAISSLRILIMYIFSLWTVVSQDMDLFYDRCSFRINKTNFLLQTHSVALIILINVFMGLFIIIYSFARRNLFLINERNEISWSWEVYFLTSIHLTHELYIQLFRFALFRSMDF